MTSMLGYNVLFQDVDVRKNVSSVIIQGFAIAAIDAIPSSFLTSFQQVIWYRHPFDYFHRKGGTDDGSGSETALPYDMYFQDDGNHATYYAPYSANTGFYYVQNNDKTQHFFNTLLMRGDMIIATKSHQAPLIALLAEHASQYGLKVKILPRDSNDFPGGHAFHRRTGYMRDVIAGKEKPYMFHMSWTLNKDAKVKYYQQLGEWYLKPECGKKTVAEIEALDGFSKKGADNSGGVFGRCCSVEATVVCHYRDKPSKIPCNDSPPIDKNGRSFWNK